MPPVDPPNGPKLALEGRVVTMDDQHTVLDRAVVWIDRGRIEHLTDVDVPPPQGFEDAVYVHTRGTIYPGLIELHNHLSYNVLPLWDVPKRYGDRAEWQRASDYDRFISWPMKALGYTPGYLEAVVRYVECKCLLGGVTTSQGITLKMLQTRRFYRGIVRNVENTGERTELPHARTKVSDVEASDAQAFRSRLDRASCYLLHLAEGRDDDARAHFLALQLGADDWAIGPSLAGIHSTGLSADDFRVMGAHGGAVVWSPLSNLLLYGQTTDVAAARREGVRIALGSDWSASGSKNLLAELKVARAVSAEQGGLFGDRDLVDMVTRVPAQMLRWDQALGSVEVGKKADLIVVYGRQDDPYANLIDADEADVSLVMINGWPRSGWPSLMEPFGLTTERVRIGGATRELYLDHPTDDPLVAGLGLGEAEDRLRDGMRRLRELGHAIEHPPPGPAAPTWVLELDHDDLEGEDLRHHLPHGGQPTGTDLPPPPGQPAAGDWYEQLSPMRLDPLTVADDGRYWERIARNRNLPAWAAAALSDP